MRTSHPRNRRPLLGWLSKMSRPPQSLRKFAKLKRLQKSQKLSRRKLRSFQSEPNKEGRSQPRATVWQAAKWTTASVCRLVWVATKNVFAKPAKMTVDTKQLRDEKSNKSHWAKLVAHVGAHARRTNVRITTVIALLTTCSATLLCVDAKSATMVSRSDSKFKYTYFQ